MNTDIELHEHWILVVVYKDIWVISFELGIRLLGAYGSIGFRTGVFKGLITFRRKNFGTQHLQLQG